MRHDKLWEKCTGWKPLQKATLDSQSNRARSKITIAVMDYIDEQQQLDLSRMSKEQGTIYGIGAICCMQHKSTKGRTIMATLLVGSVEDGKPPASSCWLAFTVVYPIWAVDRFKRRSLLLAS